ncbi:MAG: methionine transporter substrate-binding protein [Bacteroidetes bacterium]|nr:methionine transporter substrate-binding protein [Bacteroidota bacterium]
MEALLSGYTAKINELTTAIAAHQKKINGIFYTRSILFIVFFAGFFLLVHTHVTLAIVLIPFTVILFLILLNRELKIGRQITFLKNLMKANQVEIDLLHNRYEKFNPGNEFIDKQHHFISDLDIFGRRSIFQLLNRTSTYSGRMKLAGWLTVPFLQKEEIKKRQQAITELSEKKDWSHHFIALGFTSQEQATDKDVIENWLEEETLFSHPVFKIIGIVLPVATVAALLLFIFNVIPSVAFDSLFFLQLMITGKFTKKINRIHDRLSRKFDSIDKYLSLITHIEAEGFKSELLNQLKQELRDEKVSAAASILQLKKSVDKLDFRMNIVVAVLLNGILLWDINIVKRIEDWRTMNKKSFLKWINIIGEFDAFISVGLYAANNPAFVMPEIETGTFIIHAQQIGHPLINEKKLVRNDYHIEGLPKIDLLTGANMAGKSTFLRTIGVNLILAMIGAPVCAEKFRFSPILLFTSLRTNDSLQENESFFYAELKRLGMLVKDYENGQRVFFLLDEILKGTNSKDQHIGSEELIKKIVQLNGAGIVATHDVELSVLSSQFPQNVRNLCFEITISNDKLHFDYKVKEGVCATMNASFLMKKMGII